MIAPHNLNEYSKRVVEAEASDGWTWTRRMTSAKTDHVVSCDALALHSDKKRVQRRYTAYGQEEQAGDDDNRPTTYVRRPTRFFSLATFRRLARPS